ncbi:TolC family protein [Niabella beijingensis]|uniref:TolC family protein n=1 Tax=Niabella beijingensis TaxID=2872700 RepID=UPI001CBFB23A|nr:TolC family protein [Niabella beijingensis]MBZ4188988.1 TolC family protein [Niabella beijingensis]
MRVSLFFCCWVIGGTAFSQVKMTLEACEAAFLNNNLPLLAQRYRISQADADIIQARIWDLPQAAYQNNIYNPENRKAFDLNKANGLEVQQLLYLGGKKKLEIAYAASNKEIVLLEFDQLLAELKTQLAETYYALYFEEKKLKDINTQLIYMTDLLEALRIQTAKGNTSLKEQVRLQSMVLQLGNDKTDIINTILQQQQLLKLLTGLTDNINTEISDEAAGALLSKRPQLSLEEIRETALTHNADYLRTLKQVAASKVNLNWQRAQNVPDLTVGGQWDQLGGAFKNEINLTVAMPLPLWKRNKGNVLKAQYEIKENETGSAEKKQQLESSIEMAYATWRNQYDQYYAVRPEDLQHLQTVHAGMLANFRKGNVTLIDFTDFMDSYRQTILQLYEMKKQVMIAAQELNRLTQAQIF